MSKDRQEVRIKKGHITMMKHPDTALYSGVMLMGSSSVTDDNITAYTDGVNKVYGRKFLESIDTDSKVRGLILHENLHIALKHNVFGKNMFMENRKMANLAADFVVNDIIYNITSYTPDKERLVELPNEGAVYDEMFHNWSMREVYRYLKQHAKPNPNKPKGKGKPCDDGEKDDGQGQGSTPSPEGTQDSDDWDTVEVNGKTYDISNSDEHDFKEISVDEAKEISEGIDKALREGGILAGRMGGNIPRHINELLKPIVDWREELREFVTSSMSGKDEFTWRKMNKRHLANDIYLPSVETEAIGEIVVGIDTSGSIGSKELTEFATELASICGLVQPESVRILWWDTMVHGEQIFKPDEYNNLASLLKPLGGGGTHVSCVSNYIKKKDIKAECVLIFTDGYVESDITWDITIPTLWMVTMNESFVPPCGRKVIFNND
jgi:hypothetical protein